MTRDFVLSPTAAPHTPHTSRPPNHHRAPSPFSFFSLSSTTQFEFQQTQSNKVFNNISHRINIITHHRSSLGRPLSNIIAPVNKQSTPPRGPPAPLSGTARETQQLQDAYTPTHKLERSCTPFTLPCTLPFPHLTQRTLTFTPSIPLPPTHLHRRRRRRRVGVRV